MAKGNVFSLTYAPLSKEFLLDTKMSVHDAIAHHLSIMS